MIISIRGCKHSRQILESVLICLWDSGDTNRMIKHKHIKHYKSKLRSNKVKYSTASGPYITTHDVKVTFSMPDFYSRKILTHRFHIDNTRVDKVIGYDMIIVRYLMVQLCLKAKF